MTRREHRSERRAREDQAVYDYLSANPKRGHRDIAQHLGVSAFSAKLVLKRLLAARRIVQLHDPTPAGIKVGKFYYVVVKGEQHVHHPRADHGV